VLQHKEQSHGLVGSLYSEQLFAIKERWSRPDPVEVGDVILVHQDAQSLAPNLRIMAGAGANLVGLRQMTAPDIAAAERDFGFAPRTLAEGLHHTFCQAPRQGDKETRRENKVM
jgi:hypothetical protein